MTTATLAILVDDEDSPLAEALADHGGDPEEALEDMARAWNWLENASQVADAAKNGGEP